MGCVTSFLDPEDGTRRGTLFRRDTVLVLPSAPIYEGTNVPAPTGYTGKKIIFVFGGPGSGKGTVMANLLEMFNLKYISGEDLILENFKMHAKTEGVEAIEGTKQRRVSILDKMQGRVNRPEKLDKNAGTIRQMAVELRQDSSELTLHWVLGLIETELEKFSDDDVILVDMIPNLKMFLTVPGFIKNCNLEMKTFEEKNPIMFAITLALDEAHLIQNITQSHACTRAVPPGGQKPQKGAPESTPNDGSDEMDNSRTIRRYQNYINSVQDFIKYFGNSERLLTVDTSCGSTAAVWAGIRDYMYDSPIKAMKGIEQVLLMGFDEDSFDHVDKDRFPMENMELCKLVPNHTQASPETLVQAILLQLRDTAAKHKSFTIYIGDTELSRLPPADKSEESCITFSELEIGQLDFFVHGFMRKSDRKKSVVRKNAQIFKVMTTLCNDALMFTEDTPDVLCHAICDVYQKTKFAFHYEQADAV